MDIDHLLAEATRLAKPSIWLLPAEGGDEHAATWGGYGPAIGEPSEIRHPLTVDLSFLPGSFDSPSCLSIYNDPAQLVGQSALHSARLPLSGTPLAAHPRESWPPLDALFLFGSSAIQHWLTEYQWQPELGYNSNFPDVAVADSYNAVFQAQHPLYSDVAFAVLGGWHFPWPDGDWRNLLDGRLIVTTFREAEPLLEAWQLHGSIRLLNRVS